MPITQARMIRLINAADIAIYRNADITEEISGLINNELANISREAQELGLTREHAHGPLFERMYNLIMDIHDRINRSIPLDAIETITAERTHFNLRRKANERSSDAHRRQRRRNQMDGNLDL